MKNLLLILFLSPILAISQTYQNPTTGTFEPSLNYRYVEGVFSVVPLFTNPLKQDTVSNFDLSVSTKKTYSALSFTGYIQIPIDNTYTFYLNSDDGSKLYINDALLIDYDGLHSLGVEKKAVVYLKAGNHKIEVNYLNATGDAALQVSYQSSTIAKKLIPNSALFRLKPVATKPVGTTFTKEEIDLMITSAILAERARADFRNDSLVASAVKKATAGFKTLFFKVDYSKPAYFNVIPGGILTDSVEIKWK